MGNGNQQPLRLELHQLAAALGEKPRFTPRLWHASKLHLPAVETRVTEPFCFCSAADAGIIRAPTRAATATMEDVVRIEFPPVEDEAIVPHYPYYSLK